jgi:hypothetical protein
LGYSLHWIHLYKPLLLILIIIILLGLVYLLNLVKHLTSLVYLLIVLLNLRLNKLKLICRKILGHISRCLDKKVHSIWVLVKSLLLIIKDGYFICFLRNDCHGLLLVIILNWLLLVIILNWLLVLILYWLLCDRRLILR